MNIVYIHGLDSDANSIKGQLLEQYCQQYHPDISVFRPDLNNAPAQVFEQLTTLITNFNNRNAVADKPSKTVIVGSSLGGYFSTLISNHMGCPALLLNPSIQPHITLQRFSNKLTSSDMNSNVALENQVLYHTTGGWAMTRADLQWFADHRLLSLTYPEKVVAFIKQGDELLDSNLALTFYGDQGAAVILQTGGDHRFSDFSEQLPMVIETLQQL